MKKQNFRDTSALLTAHSAGSALAAVLDPPQDGSTPTPSAAPAVRPSQDRRPLPARPRQTRPATSNGSGHRFAALVADDHGANRQAELFYLQKQIQQQTQMVFVLEDGSRVQGVVEWYDRHSIKVRGKSRVLLYKSAIKYLYKLGEPGSGAD